MPQNFINTNWEPILDTRWEVDFKVPQQPTQMTPLEQEILINRLNRLKNDFNEFRRYCIFAPKQSIRNSK